MRPERKKTEREKEDMTVQIGAGLMIGIPILAMLTHILTCLAEGTYVLLLAGAVFFPVGIIHGIGIWIGVY